jgi:outer membrane protein assembly factor BamB
MELHRCLAPESFLGADPVSGRQKDSVEVGVYIAASPALSEEKAFFGDYEGTLYCLDLQSRKILWKAAATGESGSILAVPAVGNGMVIVGNEDKYIYCYNVSDGKLKWKFRTNGPITGSAIITSDKVLFSSTDGNVYLLRQSDGTKIWNFYAGSPVSSSPAVIKDNFVILTDDGRVLSFGLKNKMTVGNLIQNKIYRLKINLLTPFRFGGSKLILAAPSSPASGFRFCAPPGVGVNEENQ